VGGIYNKDRDLQGLKGITAVLGYGVMKTFDSSYNVSNEGGNVVALII